MAVDLYTDGVSIGELSRRTGVGISTLRAWERRYDFPIPLRAASGHRRYREADVDAVLTILRERADGSTLEAAVRRAKARADAPRTSVFATLRDALTDVTPTPLAKRAMLALSHAIEDEAATRADHAVFVGTFQRRAFWRASQPRWRAIATRAELAIAAAAGVPTRNYQRLWQVPIDASAPLGREWAVICDSPTFAACVVGVERPARPDETVRRFDALWTVEPFAVRAALRTALDLIATDAALRAQLPASLEQPAVATYDTIRAATSLTNRVLAYLDTAAIPARATG